VSVRSAVSRLALGLALLALAAPARSAPLSYVEARDILTHSDRVAVEHLRAVLYSVKDARGAERRRYRTERVSMAEADTAWAHAFARALLAAGPSDSLKRCAPRPELGDTVDAFAAGVTFHAGARTVGVMLFFGARCAQVFGSDGPAASIDLGTHAQDLLERVQHALPADTAFARLAMAEPLPADTAGRTFPLAVAGEVDSLPRALVTRPPRWPADAPGPGPVEVRVLALIDENGAPVAVRAREPRPPFDAAAVASVRQWRFQPARRAGRAVKAWVEIPVRFEVR
jgi:TonB family protein